MKLRINSLDTAFSLENEKFLGEVVHSIDSWLEQEGHILTALSVNGEPIPADELEQAGSREISAIESLDITAINWLVIYREALEETERIFTLDRKEAREAWQNSPAESFLLSRDRELHKMAQSVLEDAKTDQSTLIDLVRSRKQEIAKPIELLDALAGELEALIPLLEDLPLALQTGNDSEAASTLTYFTRTVETLLRLVPLFKASGLHIDTLQIGDLSFPAWMEDLLNVLTELVEGYTNRDIILVGDLSEYEIAPRLAALGPALRELMKAGTP